MAQNTTLLDLLHDLFGSSGDEPEPDRPSSSEDITGEMPLVEWEASDDYPVIDGYRPARIIDTFMAQQKTQGPYRDGRPRGIIVHHLAGHDGAERAMKSSILKAAYKYDTIGSDGAVCLSGDYGRWGSHAGDSFHPELGNGHGVSQWLHGVEVTTAGLLTEAGGEVYPWWAFFTDRNDPRHGQLKPGAKPIDKAQARFVEKDQWSNVTQTGWYHAYSELQEKSLVWLVKYYKIEFGATFKYCLGHDEVAVQYKRHGNGEKDRSSVNVSTFKRRLGRKNDPGGSLSMSMDDLRAEVGLIRGW